MNYIYVFAIIMLIVFVSAVLWFLYASNYSIRSIEILLPAFGAMIFTLFLIFKSSISIKEIDHNFLGYINIIFENDGRVVSYPSLEDSLNSSITKHTFYMDYIFMESYLKDYLKSKYDTQDVLDTVEYVFVDKLFKGWIIKNDDNKFFQKNFSATEFVSQSKNKMFLINKAEVARVNQDPYGSRRLLTFREEMLLSESKPQMLKLPKNMVFTYTYEPERRILSFSNKVLDFNLILFNGGVNNFRPEHNKFHEYLAKFAYGATPRDSGHLQMKKFYISFNYKFKKYASLRDDYPSYENFIKNIQENLINQFFWEPLKKKLETEYLLAK